MELATPDVDELRGVVRTLREWQHDEAAFQLHPGDLGWAWRQGPETTAAEVRTWWRDGAAVGIGFLDGPGVLRLTTAPGTQTDEPLARRIVDDVSDPGRGVLPAGEAAVEAPSGSRVSELLVEAGWRPGEAWSPLCRDLAEPVEAPGLWVEVVGAELVSAYTAVHRSAFGSDRLNDERWRAMTTGPAYDDARPLLVHDDRGRPVAGVTVWSAGPGRPGLLEPLGVHADHRGQGHGRTICLAAAAVLREMGCSQAQVCTPSTNVAAVAAYRSAGYHPLPQRLDRSRDA